MKTVVLAGGAGTRLRQRVPDLPKPMASVAGRPFLEYLLDRLLAAGLREITLSVGYRADSIIAHFGDAYGEARLSYAVEKQPLGTGGAMAHALSGASEAALVLNGDTLLEVDYAKLIDWYLREPVRVAMVLKPVPDTARYGSVEISGERVTGFAEKGKAGAGLINAGVYIVQPAVFAQFGLSGRFSFEQDLLARHCKALSPRAFPTEAYFIDIGVPEDYERAQGELPRVAHGR